MSMRKAFSSAILLALVLGSAHGYRRRQTDARKAD